MIINLKLYWPRSAFKPQGDLQLIDNGRTGTLEDDYSAGLIEPAIVWRKHRLSLRYEKLMLENTVTAQAPVFIAANVNLINDGHGPGRLSVSWHWFFIPTLRLLSEYVQDDVLEKSRDPVMMGLVWQQRLWQGH